VSLSVTQKRWARAEVKRCEEVLAKRRKLLDGHDAEKERRQRKVANAELKLAQAKEWAAW